MRKTVVVLLTSLLLASLPAESSHTGYPGATQAGETPGTTVPVPGEGVSEVVHDCTGDAPASGNDLASVWVGTGDRPVDTDGDGDTDGDTDGDGERDGDRVDIERLVLVDVVLRARPNSDGPTARLSIRMEANNVVRTTVIESPSESPNPDEPIPPRSSDWRGASTITYIAEESTMEPLTYRTREIPALSNPDPTSPPLPPWRVVELGYRFSDVFAPGSTPAPEELAIDGKWVVKSLVADGDGFAEADVMPGTDATCTGYVNKKSAVLVPEAPAVTDVTATWEHDPKEDPDHGTANAVDRKPSTMVTFTAHMDLGGGDATRADYQYKWTFTNGEAPDVVTITSTDAEPKVRFPELGPVDVTLVVTDDLGVSTPEYRYSAVAANNVPLVTFENLDPVADFRIQGAEIPVAGDAVTFEDLSFDSEEDDIVAWTWDFGDESATDNAQNPSHTFAGVGVYDVRLTVTDEHDGTDDHVLRVFVCAELQGSDCKPPNAAPQASFLPSAKQVVQGDTVTFTDTSTDRDGTIASWSWDFGDGGSSDEQHPEHVFDKVGIFQVTLTVTDDGGLVGTRAVAVRVALPEPEDGDDGDPTDLLPAPLSAFTVDPEDPVVGEPVRFRDATTAEAELVSWTWFFGDGSDAGDGPDVSHTYKESGTYTVRLTVQDERGVRDTTAQTIVVGSGKTDEGAPGPSAALLLVAVGVAATILRRRD